MKPPTKPLLVSISSICLFLLIILLGLYCTPKGDSTNNLEDAAISEHHHPPNTKPIIKNPAWPEAADLTAADIPWTKYNSITESNIDAFMLDMRDYVLNDLIPADFDLETAGNWYSLQYPTGREPIHGAFNPGGTHPRPAKNTSDIHFVTTYYNVFGGVTLKENWDSLSKPNENINYLEGTVIAQLDLFTYKQPMMDGAPSWKILGNKDGTMSKDTITVWLGQFEIALKDGRLSKSGWSYLKYAYDKNYAYPDGLQAPAKEWGKYDGLKKMAPVGANWIGEDNIATSVFSKYVDNSIKREFVAADGHNLTTVGQKVACTSCHASAQWNKNNLCCNAGSNLANNFRSGDPFTGTDWVMLDNDLLIKLAAGSLIRPLRRKGNPYDPCDPPCDFQRKNNLKKK